MTEPLAQFKITRSKRRLTTADDFNFCKQAELEIQILSKYVKNRYVRTCGKPHVHTPQGNVGSQSKSVK